MATVVEFETSLTRSEVDEGCTLDPSTGPFTAQSAAVDLGGVQIANTPGER